METYIAFLRAINVGGRTVKMDRLRELFTGLGLEGVRTYIQSGNVFFRTAEADRAALTARIEAGLEDGLGYPVPVLLRTVEEVEALLALEPFAAVEPAEDKRLCVLFLSEPLPEEVLAALPVASPKGDWEMVGATADAAFVVMYVRNGRLNGNPATAFPKSYRGHATSRFFHTTGKIVAAARKG
ncbi:DUF1697 domain-containing protein [Kitasatospora phosalacinea]|uniref:DUF1697 domain-containing protein n=1 Tax=Kitasatospora phosalacinea TaxID=2065 RepID=UPI00365F718A